MSSTPSAGLHHALAGLNLGRNRRSRSFRRQTNLTPPPRQKFQRHSFNCTTSLTQKSPIDKSDPWAAVPILDLGGSDMKTTRDDRSRAQSVDSPARSCSPARRKDYPRETMTPNRKCFSSVMKGLRVQIPRNLKLHSSPISKKRRGRRSIFDPTTPASSRNSSANGRRTPLHMWKIRHVARWMNKVAPQFSQLVIERKLNGERMLRVRNTDDLLELGFPKVAPLGKVLKELQHLQTDDVIWHVRSLRSQPVKECKSRVSPTFK